MGCLSGAVKLNSAIFFFARSDLLAKFGEYWKMFRGSNFGRNRWPSCNKRKEASQFQLRSSPWRCPTLFLSWSITGAQSLITAYNAATSAQTQRLIDSLVVALTHRNHLPFAGVAHTQTSVLAGGAKQAAVSVPADAVDEVWVVVHGEQRLPRSHVPDYHQVITAWRRKRGASRRRKRPKQLKHIEMFEESLCCW